MFSLEDSHVISIKRNPGAVTNGCPKDGTKHNQHIAREIIILGPEHPYRMSGVCCLYCFQLRSEDFFGLEAGSQGKVCYT